MTAFPQRTFLSETQLVRLVLLFLIALLLPACTEPSPKGPSVPDQPVFTSLQVNRVLLIVVDCMRADRVSSYGYGRPTTPTIDSVAADGIRFTRAYAQSNWTKPSVASMFTGRYVRRHGVTIGTTVIHRDGSVQKGVSYPLPGDLPVLAESFRAEGFRTVGFVENSHLVAAQGFSRGFDQYVHGNLSARRLRHWFQNNPDVARSFAFLHVTGPHDPYDNDSTTKLGAAFAAYRNRFVTRPPGVDFTNLDYKKSRQLSASDVERASQLYDAELAFYDGDHLGPLFDFLRERGLYDEMLVIITADHGEELFDHKSWAHGHSLFDEVIHVPLIIKLPNSWAAAGSVLGAGSSVDEIVELISLYPTLTELADLEEVRSLDGRSLSSLLLGEREVDTRAFAVTEHGRDIPGEILAASVVQGSAKLIWKYDVPHGPSLLGFDSEAEPFQFRSLLEVGEPQIAHQIGSDSSRKLSKLLVEVLGRGSEVEVELPDSVRISSQDMKHLKALGYVD